jgi:hypothetical protein
VTAGDGREYGGVLVAAAGSEMLVSDTTTGRAGWVVAKSTSVRRKVGGYGGLGAAIGALFDVAVVIAGVVALSQVKLGCFYLCGWQGMSWSGD